MTEGTLPALDEGKLHAAETRLSKHQIDAIAATYIDNAGIARVKAIPVERLDAALRSGIGMSPVFDAFLFNDHITESRYSGGPMGDLRLFLDLDSLTPIPSMPGWALGVVDRFDQYLRPHPNCSRGFLRRQLAQLADNSVAIKMGFEIEWVVSRGDDASFVPATDGSAYGLTRIVDLAEYARVLLVNLRNAELIVEQLHPEYAPGQFEISLPAMAPLAAVDRVVLAKTIIRSTGRAFGLATSFAPVVEVNGVGNGGHVHLSATRNNVPIFGGGDGPGGLTAVGADVIATLLDWLPGLLAVGAPSPASYLRLVPSHWAGAFQCWGIENREAALRLVAQSSLVASSNANLEVKCFDQSANPYLVAGALLAGVHNALDGGPPLPDPVACDPARLPDAPRLPQSLEESIAKLWTIAPLLDAMGPELAEAFIAVRKAELVHFASASADTIVAETRWVY
ncbi:glutamine synthetase family protein [Ferrimicrobium sp.]|uniref:glutamine synthetase family protein n=1 Tax=Ferrimicrobium sp. TaxID=2926050 RepID=UPI00260975C8|nr:glutamine synthetase family protein [Ferrimicrobium sp.]